jgi:hypothetical protein
MTATVESVDFPTALHRSRERARELYGWSARG